MKPAFDLSALKFEVAETYEAMSRRAAQLVAAELKQRRELIFCASAGGTPTLLYELLAERCRREPRLFQKMRVLQIDEWGGLPAGDPASCEEDLRGKLLEPLRISKDRYAGFNSQAKDPKAECGRIAKWLTKNGRIDICILGLGINGHVAMNEPAARLVPHAHRAKLTPSSLNHPMLKRLQRKPRFGLTLGMVDILCSRMILLLVNGRHKRAALRKLMKPMVTSQFPASFLWLHPQAIVLCDREAAPLSTKKQKEIRQRK
jgi:galactosamine-6-phosphate isomerase